MQGVWASPSPVAPDASSVRWMLVVYAWADGYARCSRKQVYRQHRRGRLRVVPCRRPERRGGDDRNQAKGAAQPTVSGGVSPAPMQDEADSLRRRTSGGDWSHVVLARAEWAHGDDIAVVKGVVAEEGAGLLVGSATSACCRPRCPSLRSPRRRSGSRAGTRARLHGWRGCGKA